MNTREELLAEAERVREKREQLVAEGEAGSYVDYLWVQERHLRRLAADKPTAENEMNG